jgi:hypothetical protein
MKGEGVPAHDRSNDKLGDTKNYRSRSEGQDGPRTDNRRNDEH